MSDGFDAYQEWLGIPPDEQPPNHYRLLDLELFEDLPELIQDAVVERTELLKTYQLSRQSDKCQDLLTEVAAALVCLLDHDKKAAYDKKLRLEMQPEVASTDEGAIVLAEVVEEAPLTPTEEVSEKVAGGLDPLDRTAVPQPANLLDVKELPPAAPPLPGWQIPAPEEPEPRRPQFSPLDISRSFDRFLAKLAGEGNEILHNFLRLLSLSALTMLMTMLIGILAYGLFQPPQPDVATAPPKPPEREPAPEATQLPEDLTNAIGMQLKLIPAGEFMMGSPGDDADKRDKETPQHRVRITKPFYLGVYEVTQEQYEKVMGENPSRHEGPSLPVERVSWEDATAFCEKLSAMDARFEYRLPTEAEWEYACRAGTKTRYSCGDDLDPQCAWFRDNSGGETHPVGQKGPNAWGLYDMHGNVWEWCQDWYGSGYYASSPSADPAGPTTGSGRVHRGGCWLGHARNCRSAIRGNYSPGHRGHNLGFRLASVPAE